MKFSWVLVFFVVAVASSEHVERFIIGGEDVSIQEHPYMAGVLNLGLNVCGGSIISSRNVLTAAHCILIRSAVAISIFVGSSRRRGQEGITHRSLRLFIHPDYKYTQDPFLMQNDIAVIRTLTQIQFGAFVQPIALGTNFVPSNSQVILTGWGLLGNSTLGDRADQLQKLSMTSIPNILCSILHIGTVGEGVVSAEKICVVAPGNSGGCGGDSGGPIVDLQGNVVGVASWAVRPCGITPTVFIRVAHHLQWIKQQI